MVTEAVGGHVARRGPAVLPLGDDVDDDAGHQPADHLREPVGGQHFPLHAAGQRRTERDGGVEVAAGDRAEGVHAGEHVRPKARATPRNPIPSDIPSADANFAANTALPQPPSTSQNVPMNSAASRCSIVGSRMRDSFVGCDAPAVRVTEFMLRRSRRVRIVPRWKLTPRQRDLVAPVDGIAWRLGCPGIRPPRSGSAHGHRGDPCVNS